MASTQTTRGTASGWNALADDFRNWLTRHVFAIVVTGVFVLANISRWVWMALHRPDRASSGLSLSFVEALTPTGQVCPVQATACGPAVCCSNSSISSNRCSS